MKIAIVNDIAVIAEALRQTIADTGEHQVEWVAYSGEEALRLCAERRPDLILMDLIMPGLDGVETTRRIMQQTPCAILLVTASPDTHTSLVFRALGAGALDVTTTPVLADGVTNDAGLLAKIRTIGKLIGVPSSASVTAPPNSPAPSGRRVDALVAIGSSTGGPAALATILKDWTPGSDTAAVMIQHIDRAFTDNLAKWLTAHVGFPIHVIEEGMRPEGGRLYIAKTNDHLLLDAGGVFAYRADPQDYPYRPSVDVFFQSIAREWRRQAVGILLTGMGRDGAAGLLAMRQAGQFTIAQDRATSTVYGMPRAAAALNAAVRVLPLDAIGKTVESVLRRKARLESLRPPGRDRESP
jgi:two-component system response regulator WspF